MTNTAGPTVETYNLTASNGRHIRKATVVFFEDGSEVRFVERLSKREAIRQAGEFRDRDVTPRQLGEEAFAAGRPCVPALDPRMTGILRPEVGSNVVALRQWVAGWTDANLAAPVDDDEQAPRLARPADGDALDAAARMADVDGVWAEYWAVGTSVDVETP